jgi:putative alpha-1,2-mannosidase
MWTSRSLIESQKASPYGILPVWQFHGLETWCMIGYHGVPVIADAYMKGLKGFDAEEALKAMTSSAEYGPYGGLQHYMKLGYVPIDLEPEAASKTVEYAFDDWTIARMAEKMGKKDIAARYYNARRTIVTRSTSRPASCGRENRTAVPRAVQSCAVQLRQRLHRRQRVAVFLVYAAR